jgi:hypothetical protein
MERNDFWGREVRGCIELERRIRGDGRRRKRRSRDLKEEKKENLRISGSYKRVKETGKKGGESSGVGRQEGVGKGKAGKEKAEKKLEEDKIRG